MNRLKIKIKSRAHAYALIGAATSLFGSANAILLGIYTITYCLRLTSWSASFLMRAYIVGIATATSAFILICGGYLMWKGRPRLGGILNFISGSITTILYLYFTCAFPLLGQLGPMGYFLLTPALISGMIGILIPNARAHNTRRNIVIAFFIICLLIIIWLAYYFSLTSPHIEEPIQPIGPHMSPH